VEQGCLSWSFCSWCSANKPSGFGATSAQTSFGNITQPITIDSGSSLTQRYERINATVNNAGTLTSVNAIYQGVVTNSGTRNSNNDSENVAHVNTGTINNNSTTYSAVPKAINALLTGYVSGAGVVAATDSILQAIQKLNGNAAASSGSAITAVTGDVTAHGPGSVPGVNVKASDGFFIYNSVDNTKQFKFDLSGQSSGFTGTVTPLLTQNEVYQIQPNVDATANIITQNATSGQIFIGANSSIGGSNSGIQYSNATNANRGQIRLGSYVNAASVAGVTTATSKSGVVGTNSVIGTSQDYSKWTAQAAATTPGSLPISGSFAFKSAASINALTVPTDFHISLENLAGAGVFDRFYLTSEGALTLSGYTTGIAHFDGSGNVTSSAINLNSADVTGALPIGNGGTGQVTANAALNALLPSQATHSSQALVTDGSNTSWTPLATAFTYFQETPSGTVNNSNVTFTLAHAPVSNAALKVYRDGQILVQGSDYTVVTTTITMASAPNFAQTLYADYSY